MLVGLHQYAELGRYFDVTILTGAQAGGHKENCITSISGFKCQI